MADMPGEITGGTECYGRRHYFCDDPITSQAQMCSTRSRLLFTLRTVVTQNDSSSSNYPSDLLVENERVKVLLGC